jgi:hypothetical protein
MAMGLVSFKPAIPKGVHWFFFLHLTLVATLIAYFPKHRKIGRYHHRLIDAYFKMGNLAQVRAEGMTAVIMLPGSPWAEEARGRLS